MTLIELIILFFLAFVIGLIAQLIVGFDRKGCLVTVAIGFIGAVLGSFLVTSVQLPELFAPTIGGKQIPIVWGIIGAVLFTLIVTSLLKIGRRKR